MISDSNLWQHVIDQFACGIDSVHGPSHWRRVEHMVLARGLENPRFRRIESFSPRNHVHHFRLASVDEIDRELRSWLREACAVGEQKHLQARGRAERQKRT